MMPRYTQLGLTPSRSVRLSGAALQVVAAAVWCSTSLSALAAENAVTDPDSPDRQMQFIEKSVEATDLFNQRKLPEALQAFEVLVRDYGDLDQDGYVATSLGDCLQALGRHEEARAMYESVAAAHPEMAEPIRQRLWEIKLAGEPDDAILAELRSLASGELENVYAIKVQLGRALQKRALAMLAEAVTVLREAAESDASQMQPARRTIVGQAEMLAELKEDLSSLIARLERGWAGMKTIKELTEPCETPDSIQGCRSDWTSRAADGQSIKLETQWQDDGTVKATVNGRPIQLNATQELIIRRHQERINAILTEAMQSGTSQRPAAR